MDGEARDRLSNVVVQLMAGRTQHAFAKELGVRQPTVHGWVHGHSFPDLDNLEQLANMMGMELEGFVAYLRTGRQEPSDPFERLVQQVESLPCIQFAQLLRLAADKLERAAS